jgi:hypothetical protein
MLTFETRRIGKVWVFGAFAVALWGGSHPVSAACLSKPLPGARAPVYVVMLAPASQLSEYQSLGFQTVACPTDLSVLRNYVDQLCSGSGDGSAPAIHTELVIGRPRAYACASARAGLAESGG